MFSVPPISFQISTPCFSEDLITNISLIFVVHSLLTTFLVDNNECAIRNGGCNQKCHNVEGGYVCSCNDNFYLTEDRRTCKGI